MNRNIDINSILSEDKGEPPSYCEFCAGYDAKHVVLECDMNSLIVYTRNAWEWMWEKPFERVSHPYSGVQRA